MARPKRYSVRRLVILTEEMLRQITEVMKAEGKSFSEAAREAFEMWLKAKGRN